MTGQPVMRQCIALIPSELRTNASRSGDDTLLALSAMRVPLAEVRVPGSRCEAATRVTHTPPAEGNPSPTVACEAAPPRDARHDPLARCVRSWFAGSRRREAHCGVWARRARA